MNAQNIKWALFGIAALVFVKYIVVGLCTWDYYFHPMRIENPNSKFLYPVLGLFGHSGNCAETSAKILME